ncbi:ecotin family protein, partial [Pseudomonas aeruginosa]|uniref:ecotin family protein n=1 Tax=Pseudomonas aeruginosa TaxID=287 RepID=UPI003968EA5D
SSSRHPALPATAWSGSPGSAPGQKKEQRFIPVVGEGFLLRYNSKLPIVVYAPKDVEVRYRIWSASEKVEKAVSE